MAHWESYSAAESNDIFDQFGLPLQRMAWALHKLSNPESPGQGHMRSVQDALKVLINLKEWLLQGDKSFYEVTYTKGLYTQETIQLLDEFKAGLDKTLEVLGSIADTDTNSAMIPVKKLYSEFLLFARTWIREFHPVSGGILSDNFQL